MSVVDASLYADALTASTPTGDAARELLGARLRWHAPAILPAEVLSAVSGLVLGGHLDEQRANRARRRLTASRISLHGFIPYAERVWELRENLTVYDGWYVAVAEALETVLVTTDTRLASVGGLRCEVRLVAA